MASADERDNGDVMARMRAAKGGETIGGRHFRGGQFIPAEYIAIKAGLDPASTKAGTKRIEKAAEKAAYRSFGHAAASIRKDARASIKSRGKTTGPSRLGEPVRTKRGRGGGLARRAILYKADKEGAVIGFAASKIDKAMEVHEHGKTRGGVKFPERPTMQPALERNLARFHKSWDSAIS